MAGSKAPQLVTRRMVENMRRGSVIIDVSIDQGGCVETSRPTTLADPSYIQNGVVHYAVPNLTADMSRSSSMALAQAMLPFLINLADRGVDAALRVPGALQRGAYTHRGTCVRRSLAEVLGLAWEPLS